VAAKISDDKFIIKNVVCAYNYWYLAISIYAMVLLWKTSVRNILLIQGVRPMRYFLLCLSIILSFNVSAVEIERDAEIQADIVGDSELINAVVGMVRGNGYTCDSLSTLYPFTFGTGYRVICNRWTLFYEVEDVGNNRWVVKRKK
jgi:hypothetical protein